ncbi:hypothetical protein SAMN05444166_4910 [Singulisphaera sp. GP187]|uniref:hypothetical protein n=1 Tax=Singulisphaera sp. GP187 TaxID=1882752 RepID=UPI000926AC92|nr:hypothetical protein [Singulisphaera sp. GP187]SIO45941.1 hypothetical protein SAMN05444166_4910 [Singulisphaera sp. GP187]
MQRRKNAGWLLAIGLLTWTAGGCGNGEDAKTVALIRTNEGLALEEIGRTYQSFVKRTQQPPKDMKDVLPSEQGYPTGINALKRGEVVVLWGAPLDRTPQGGSSVLAYEKKAPESGGIALMQDLSLKQLSADEFKAAPKAPGTASAAPAAPAKK